VGGTSDDLADFAHHEGKHDIYSHIQMGEVVAVMRRLWGGMAAKQGSNLPWLSI
jgi:hypothetical protein